ncbi:VQ motif-containing protein 9-like [Salvia divinorum]|uniref:VQ motif-containing protein 9-like n=1 Tax=Salvia divinorum TaxID=28513 RepID=A0ABD1GS65_SALDI
MEKGGFVGDDSASSASHSNSGSSSSASNRDAYLKHVTRNSHKISKPIRKPLPPPPSAAAVSILDPNPAQSQQPPVYNINKSDFRDVVQKLTGSPAHERFSAPAAPQTRPPSSRLQRIRPPPLSQIANRPQIGGVQQPLTPLPPLPSVHPAAESPISAYMRFFQNSASASSSNWPSAHRPDALIPQSESPVSAYMRFLQSSYTSSTAPPQQSTLPPPQLPNFATSFASMPPFPALPLSPLPFGCIPSPKSPYGALFSPTAQLGLQQLPLSPTLPLSKGM